MVELLYGKEVNIFNPISEEYEKATVICHYGKYSDTCHRIFGGIKETWQYPNLIDVRFKNGAISRGHFVPHYLTGE